MKAGISRYIDDLSDSELSLLKEMGLSEHEIQLYQVLVHAKQAMSAQDVASVMMVYPNALYRLFNELARHGLVQKIPSRPQRFEALEKQKGLSVAYQHHQDKLRSLLASITREDLEGAHIIMGRGSLYEAYIQYAAEAQRAIDVFAIGIAYNEKLYITQEAAFKRGVAIRHVVQRVKPQNFHIIHKWQSLGVKVRYLPEAQGYHVTVIDNETALITFSDPNDTEDRLTIITHHPTALKLFNNQFESIWAASREIPVKI